MYFEASFLFVLIILSTILTFVIMRLKKKKLSACLLAAFCLLSVAVYFNSSFPWYFGTNTAEQWISSAIPLKNLILSRNIICNLTDGTSYNDLTDFYSIHNYIIMDLVLSVLVSSAYCLVNKKVSSTVIFSSVYCLSLISVRIIFYLTGVSLCWFDTSEYIVCASGIALGLLASSNINKYKSKKL